MKRDLKEKYKLTTADPITYTREPLRISWSFGVNKKTRLLTSVTKGSKSVVPVLASAALPVPFSPFSHSSTPPLSLYLVRTITNELVALEAEQKEGVFYSVEE